MGKNIAEISEVYGSGDAQAPIYLDDYNLPETGVQLEPVVVGSGYVQATLSTREAVEDGEAQWVTWPVGTVSSVTQDTIDRVVTAIRAYRVSGAIRLTVRFA